MRILCADTGFSVRAPTLISLNTTKAASVMMLHAFYGDGATPRIVIDGNLAHAASVPKIEDLAKWLKN